MPDLPHPSDLSRNPNVKLLHRLASSKTEHRDYTFPYNLHVHTTADFTTCDLLTMCSLRPIEVGSIGIPPASSPAVKDVPL